MTPSFLCLIILAMPLAIAAYMAFPAWAEQRAVSAKAYWSNAGDDIADVDDDNTLFR